MSNSSTTQSNRELLFTYADIQRAVREGIISAGDAERLVEWGYAQRFNRMLVPESLTPAPEQRRGLNAVMVAYYFGAMLMISAIWLTKFSKTLSSSPSRCSV